ncbi:MAG: hypothetical protein FJ280_22070 [Planctomycetes bacterium]|nr:hypothetical protein [Planctomycetota bacterium]
MKSAPHPAVGRIGPYRAVHLSKILDPATEKRRCAVRRHEAPVLGVTDYHSESEKMTVRIAPWMRDELERRNRLWRDLSAGKPLEHAHRDWRGSEDGTGQQNKRRRLRPERRRPSPKHSH